MSSAVSIKNMSVAFKNFALKNVNLEIEPGTIMGLVGENGAGKTTILKSMLNFYRLKQGSISVFGKDHLEDEIEVKNLIGYIADEDYLKYDCTLKKYGKLFAPIYKNWNQTIFEEQIKRWNLPMNQRFSEFSKGMKTKAMLALALAHEPKILVLDEPTAGLDPVARAEFLEMLREFVADGERAVLFSTHITTDLDKVADYVTLLIDGEVIASGAIDWWDDTYVLAICDEAKKNVLEKVAIGMKQQRSCVEALIVREDMEQVKESIPNVQFKRPDIEQIMVHQILQKRKERGQ